MRKKEIPKPLPEKIEAPFGKFWLEVPAVVKKGRT